MKKTLIIGALLAGSLSAYSQGTILFQDKQTDMNIHIFAPSTGGTFAQGTIGSGGSAVTLSGTEVVGNQAGGNGVSADVYYNNGTDANIGSAGGNTGGSTVYSGGAIGNTLSGNATPAGLYNYNNGKFYTVELYAAPGLNAALSALQPVTQYITTIATSSANGGTFASVIPGTDPGIPGTSGGSATIALVAWYNGTGATSGLSLAAAVAAGDPAGYSPLDNIVALGTTGSPPATAPDMQGLQSFDVVAAIPEPSTIALGVIGASTLLFRRRK
jgi:hypothetical protein